MLRTKRYTLPRRTQIMPSKRSMTHVPSAQPRAMKKPHTNQLSNALAEMTGTIGEASCKLIALPAIWASQKGKHGRSSRVPLLFGLPLQGDFHEGAVLLVALTD